MSLKALSGSSTHFQLRSGHLHAVRAGNAQVEIEARAQVPTSNESKRDSLVDVVARQLNGGVAAAAFAPVVAKRASKAIPFGRRNADDNYVGPIDLEQDEFSVKPTRVRRQVQSPQPNPPAATWNNGDVGVVQALYSNGTFKNLMVANVVYATQGSEDGSADGAVPLQAQIVTSDGGPITAGTPFALLDFLGVYTKTGPKPYIGVTTGQNVGAPYWAAPVTSATNANVWTIDITTGELSATYLGSVLKFATNDNTVPPSGSVYSGNGDTDAWPSTGTPTSQHSPATLRLVKLS